MELTSELSKGWRPRAPRAATSPEHPGSAVSWADEVYEVTGVTPLADGRTRYTLSLWDSRHAIRTLERYDAATETARVARHAEMTDAVRRRKLSILFAPALGHLPGAVQERMEREFGAPALFLTCASALPLFVLGVLTFLGFLTAAFGGRLAPAAGGEALFPFLRWLPPPLGMYLLAESAVRLASAAATSRPCGSLVGVLGWEVWRIARRTRDPALPVTAPPLPVDSSIVVADRYRLLEPLLGLLRPGEQEWLSERYGFDALRWGRRTAMALMLFGWLNVVISLVALMAATAGVGDFLWLLAGFAIVIEQLARRRALAQGRPAGSLLAVIVRPLARGILASGR